MLWLNLDEVSGATVRRRLGVVDDEVVEEGGDGVQLIGGVPVPWNS